MNKIIIALVTYNCLKYTKLCIQNLRCSYPHEILVVDNGSIDGTVEWLKEQDNITVIANGQNLGYPYAHNEIWDYVWKDDESTLVFLLSNDMLPLPNAVDVLVEASMETEKSIVSGVTLPSPVYCATYPDDRRFFRGGDRINTGAAGYTTWSPGPFYNIVEETMDEFVSTMFGRLVPLLPEVKVEATGSFFPGGHRVYRKSYFDAIGYFDVNFYPVFSADLDYSMRASVTGQEAFVCQASLCLEFWSRCIYENVSKTRDVRRDDYYREKWGPKAVGFASPGYEGWIVPFNGEPQPSKFDGYDASQVRISSREGELERIELLMGSNFIGGVDPSISRSMDRKHDKWQ